MNLVDFQLGLVTQRAGIREDVFPLREFTYGETQEEEERLFTLQKDGVTFVIKDDWAKGQFCHLMGYPVNVFETNSAELNAKIVRERLPQIKARELRVKWIEPTVDHREVKAILPKPYSTIADAELVKIALDKNPDLVGGYGEILGTGAYFRVLGDVMDTIAGSAIRYGINIQSSEVGKSNLKVDTVLSVEDGENGFFVQWGDKPWLVHNYRGATSNDMNDLYTNSLAKLASKKEELVAAVRKAVDTNLTAVQLNSFWDSLTENRQASKAFIGEIRESFPPIAADGSVSFWKVINHLSHEAQDLPAELRLRHERLAGFLIKLRMAE